MPVKEKKWWARLTKDKTKNLKKILDVPSLRNAFDNLLDVTDLWSAFRIGIMRRYLVLRCHEVGLSSLFGTVSDLRICSNLPIIYSVSIGYDRASQTMI